MDNLEHKQKIRTIFDAASEGYDNPALDYFAKSAKTMVSDMKLTGSELLLDLATGTGHVALAAARELSTGSVTGLDISDNMLAKARAKADTQNLRNVSFIQGDIDETDGLDGNFDLASCAFGIFFLPDIEGGLRTIARAIRAGGRLFLTSFGSSFMEPQRGMLMARLKALGVEQPNLSIALMDTPEKVTGLLRATGYKDIKVRARQLGYYLNNAREWMDTLWHTAFRGVLSQLSEAAMKKLIDEHLNEVDKLRDDRGIWLDIEVLFTEARTAC